MTKEQIHNIYLHMTGKAEGLLEAGAEADFPIMFAEAIIQYNKPRELTDEEIDNIFGISALNTTVNLTTEQCYLIVDAILKKAGEK
jgi:hypothetical protein